eukprot:m.36582 g.36582  ORF g.36582 m.36582 type:complete len:792 (+) comp12869_c0_seq2:390-2765(+)
MSQVSSPAVPTSPIRSTGSVSHRGSRVSSVSGGRRDPGQALDFVPADVASMRFSRPSIKQSTRKSLPGVVGGPRKSRASTQVQRQYSSVQFGNGGERGSKDELVETRKSTYLPSLRPPRQGSSGNVVRTEMERRLTEQGLDTHVIHKHDVDSATLLLGSLSQEQEIYHSAITDVISSISEGLPSQAKLLVDIRDNYQLLFAKVPQQVHKITADLGLERDLNAELLAELRRARRAIKECSQEMEILMEEIAPTAPDETAVESDTLVPDSNGVTGANRFLAQIDCVTAEESQSATQLIHHLENLYEMQRDRMEHELESARGLTGMWITAADKLSQLVGDESTVETLAASRLTASCWIENARKIMSTVEARDADVSMRVECHVGEWKTHVGAINRTSQKAREIGLLALRTIVREAQKMVKEQSVATGVADKTRAWNKTMILGERWVATLDKRQEVLTAYIPKGGVDRLERLCTSWSDLGDILFRCHKVNQRSNLRRGLYAANELERSAVATAREHERFYSSVLGTIDRFREAISAWRSSSKVVNHDKLTAEEFSKHIMAVHKLEKALQSALDSLAAATKPTSQKDVPTSEWSASMADWLLRLEADVLSQNRTLVAQIQKISRSFQEWTISSEMAAGRVKGAHPMDALSKHSALWKTVDEVTTSVTNSVDATSGDSEIKEEFWVRETDLDLLRDQATEWEEHGRLVVDRLQMLHADKGGGVDEDTTPEDATTVQTTTRAGGLIEIALPDEGVIRSIMESMKTTSSDDGITKLTQYLNKFVELEERRAIRNARKKR